MRAEKRIDYIEIPVTDLTKARAFFGELFGWSFEEWGEEYLSFNDGQLDGGFRLAAEPVTTGGILVIFYSTDLERDLERVQELGATICEPVFPFPGGRRFHFVDPTGTEYAIWSTDSGSAHGD